MNRKLSKSNYIEIQNKHKKSNIQLFKNIIENINNQNLSIKDFFLDKSCNIEKFIVYDDKKSYYIKELPNIEIELIKLYNNGTISYVGYQ